MGYSRKGESGSRLHPTQKAIEVVASVVSDFSGSASILLDPFLGSGTTLVACEQTGRIGYGMEITEKYVSVSLQRMSDMGLEPRLASTMEAIQHGAAHN